MPGWIIGTLLIALYGAISWFSFAEEGARAICTYVLWACFPLYLGAGYLQWRKKESFGWPMILGGAIAMRLVLSFSFPIFSDDIWRYLWDGHVQWQGINPFLYAPNSAELAPFTTDYHGLINHPEVPTIYPGVSQLIFGLVVGVGGGETVMRLLFAAAEMAVVPAVWRLAGAGADKPKQRALLALLCWWNPLMVVEFAGSGHLDPLAFTPLVWALALIQAKGKADGSTWIGWVLAGALIGVSIGAKLVGGIAFVGIATWTIYKSTRLSEVIPKLALAGAAALVVMVAVSIPYHTPAVFGVSANFGGTLSNYARKWRWNDGPYRALFSLQEAGLYQVEGASKDKPPMWKFDEFAGLFEAAKVTHEHEGKKVASTTMPPWELAAFLVKFYTLGLIGLLGLLAWNQGARPTSTTMLLFGTALLFSAVVHPWYVAWLLPLALADRIRGFFVWSGLVTLSYIPGFGDMTWLLAVEYVPVLGLLGWDVWRGIRGQQPELA